MDVGNTEEIGRMKSTITGGEFRGRKILSPKTSITHPMGSRERLALFNALGARIDLASVKVLDAYAGTGALGLEALSRGAREVVFIEKNRAALAVLAKNLDNFQLKNRTKIVYGDVGKIKSNKTYDLIFIDPPYDDYRENEFRHLVDYLSDDGLLVVSHPDQVKIQFDGLSLVSRKKYARAVITILKKVESLEGSPS